jgi:hypothetical protein
MSSEFKPVWGKDTIKFDWCEYSFDGGMITVRKSVTKDVAKFKTQAEAMAFIKQQEGAP